MQTVMEAKRGDIVRFKSYALRVEVEPIHHAGAITLSGRISVDGCPTVTRKFNASLECKIDRA